MSNIPNNSSEKSVFSELLSWGIIIFFFSVFWPVGLILLIRKLTSYGSKKNTSSHRTQNSARAQSTQTARPAGSSAKAQAAPAKRRGRAVPVLLIVLGIILALSGLGYASDAIDMLRWAPEYVLSEAVSAVFNLLGAGACFLSSAFMSRRAKRFDKLKLVFGTRDIMSIKDMSVASGIDEKRIRKDLDIMVDRGYFGASAYVDKGLDSLVSSPEKAEQARQTAYAAEKAAQKAAKNEKLSQYESILKELDDLDIAIEDEFISEKIQHIGDVTAKIFDLVTEKPEKLPQIKKFMDYYLPTTLKLLRSYSVMERQGIEGENISATKEKIGRILDTLSAGFEQQLDQLFKADALDISSDIDVLETMMKSDGLHDEGSLRAGH